MVNESDNTNNDEPTQAEILYRQYQQTRSQHTRSQHKSTNSDNITTLDTNPENATLTENVYKQYQQDRNDSKEASIDAIMHAIDSQPLELDDRQDQQPIGSAQLLEIQSIDAKSGQVFDGATSTQPAANNSSVFKRFALPAIAAGLLSIAIIPAIINNTSEPEALQASLPSAIIDNAEQSIAYLDDPSTQAFGMSENTDARNTAFNLGVSMTELELLIETDQRDKIKPYVSKLALIQGSSNSESAERGTVQGEALFLISGINVNAEQSRLKQNLASLRGAVESTVNESGEFDWYSAGRSVELIRIASEYALGQVDSNPLEQTLNSLSDFTYPDDISSITPLFGILAETSLSQPDEFEQASQLLDTTNSIKVLMQ